MKDLRLVEPCAAYMDSYHQFCLEMKATGQRNFSCSDPDTYETWKDTLLQDCRDHAQGKNLPEGYVPCTLLWLMDGEEVVGMVRIRHCLSEELRQMGGHIGYGIKPSKWRQGYGERQLRLALPAAKALGIKRALITCNDNNIGSARIIEKNGGELEGVFDVIRDGESTRIRRYWVVT